MFRVCFVPQQRRAMNKAQIIDMFGETIATFIQEILGDNGDEQLHLSKPVIFGHWV